MELGELESEDDNDNQDEKNEETVTVSEMRKATEKLKWGLLQRELTQFEMLSKFEAETIDQKLTQALIDPYFSAIWSIKYCKTLFNSSLASDGYTDQTDITIKMPGPNLIVISVFHCINKLEKNFCTLFLKSFISSGQLLNIKL